MLQRTERKEKYKKQTNKQTVKQLSQMSRANERNTRQGFALINIKLIIVNKHQVNNSNINILPYCNFTLHHAVNTELQPPSSITQGGTTTTVSVSWSPVSGATGYYVSYQRQDLGAPPVVTPQYERIVGGATSVTLSGLEPGTTYRIRVWSIDGTSVSSEARERNVTTVESDK